MKYVIRLTIAILLVVFGLGASAAPRLPVATPVLQQAPQIASYRIDARLDPQTKTVAGVERVTYTNPSGDTLNEIWLRLYLRAFRDTTTTWMREAGSVHRGFASGAGNTADLTISRLALPDGTDLLAAATISETLMHVPLTQPLAPGQRLELDIAWESRLPRVFARTGYGGRDDTFFMVGQWYPKMAVYDRGRWDTEPWHANAEFFHDFGTYEVNITAPREYLIAGAGLPAGEQDNGDGTRTSRFRAEQVTDFAFAASPDFLVSVADAGGTTVTLYYLPEHADLVTEYMNASVGSLLAFNEWYGQYPHPRLTVIDIPDNASGAGGMEYPTLITGGTLGAPAGVGTVTVIAAHEVAHQWWPMQTATNEAREPWLDEGLAEYSGSRYMVEAGTRIGFGPLSIGAQILERASHAVNPIGSVSRPAWEYSEVQYGSLVYNKTALGLWTLEGVVGTREFRQAMAAYLTAYRFKHPTAADFRASIEQSLGPQPWFFDDFVESGGIIDYGVELIDTAGLSITVRRHGAVRVPVDVQVTLASGTVRTQEWNGLQESETFAFSAEDPVVRVDLDPQRKLKAEIALSDNSMSRVVQPIPAVTLGGRLAFWMQTLIQVIGMFG